MKRAPLPGYAPGLIAVAVLWSFPVLAAAAEKAVGEASAVAFGSGYIMQVIGSLALVLMCLFAVLALLKKMNGISGGDGHTLRVLSSLKVGNREKILLLEAGDSQLLVGVAAGNVRTLHVLDSAAGETGQGKRDFASLMPAGASPAQGE